MGVVREYEVEAKLAKETVIYDKFINLLTDIRMYNDNSFITKEVLREVSMYVKIQVDKHRVRITKELRKAPYRSADKPSKRRKSYGKKKESKTN